MYADGRGGEQDYDQALRFYREAALLGNVDALTDIGHMYQQGMGVERSIPEAVRWYERAVSAGDVQAMQALAHLYEDGVGIPVNLDRAWQLYSMIADRTGDLDAVNWLKAHQGAQTQAAPATQAAGTQPGRRGAAARAGVDPAAEAGAVAAGDPVEAHLGVAGPAAVAVEEDGRGVYLGSLSDSALGRSLRLARPKTSRK